MFLLVLLASTLGLQAEKVGLLYMHGCGQSFDHPGNVDFKNFVEQNTGVTVHLIDAFNDLAAPPTESSITPMWIQVPAILEQVKNISAQYDKIIAVGYSQGGVIWRAMIEDWNNHNVDTFIAMASPQHGFADLPQDFLVTIKDYVIDSIQGASANNLRHNFLKAFLYSKKVQNVFSPSNFFLEPAMYNLYKNTRFFPRLNNEVGPDSEKQRQKKNFERLRKFVMVGGPDDGVINPWQSEIFGFRTVDRKIVSMNETEFYKKNLFGLRTLDEKGCTNSRTEQNSNAGQQGLQLSGSTNLLEVHHNGKSNSKEDQVTGVQAEQETQLEKSDPH
ncbi:hypothetical protein ACHWQZ_G014070 [Mnemiopsis leidyi]